MNILEAPQTSDVRLPPHHPGFGDAQYLARRNEISRLVAEAEGRAVDVRHTPEEERVFRLVRDRLAPLHDELACAPFRRGVRDLGFGDSEIAPFPEIDATLRARTGFGVVLTDGLLDPRAFLAHLGSNRQPCTAYLRHGSRPEYTPEPDLVHEAIGHMPMLADPVAARLNRLIGARAADANPRQLEALLRIYWFTLEFGLVEERAGPRAYGAGLLSSFGELPHAFSEAVDRRAFSVEAAVAQTYQHDALQNVLFVAKSLRAVEEEVAAFVDGDAYALMGEPVVR
jgi:phenylalanine-4-hydroxylase